MPSPVKAENRFALFWFYASKYINIPDLGAYKDGLSCSKKGTGDLKSLSCDPPSK